MNIFRNEAYIRAAKDYATTMVRTHPDHILSPDSPYFGSGKKIIALEKVTGADRVMGAGSFEHTMLQALDKVSGAQQYASNLSIQALTDPDSVDVHDVTIAQAQANMSLDITRNILSRLIQGWRDLINTR